MRDRAAMRGSCRTSCSWCLVLSVNLVIFAAGVVAGWWVPHARSLEVIAAISQVNLLFAILPAAAFGS